MKEVKAWGQAYTVALGSSFVSLPLRPMVYEAHYSWTADKHEIWVTTVHLPHVSHDPHAFIVQPVKEATLLGGLCVNWT